MAEGRNAGTRVPSAVVLSAEGANELPSAEPEWEHLAAPTGISSPTPLEMLAGHGVEAVAKEAMRPCARESPRILAATEILESEDDTPPVEEEVQSMRGTPTGVLCEHVDQCALARKLQKAALKLRDEMVANARCEIDELRVKRAAAELQLAEIEGHNRRPADRTREELVARVGRCLRGYAHREVATRERVTLRELEMRATALMAGDGRSRRWVAKWLEAFLFRSQDAVANLEAEVIAEGLIAVGGCQADR
ncbi:hypothetical protein AXG93_4620s2090 [Marchantia polymorpha subsp. ruderalis]|uniref:Uncharacterized protein n=1 Tax=Marchantia polymorpha subsp. ruderalis TaxID=1480154 RepID=A0A176VX50_MARPO|nr:hypothetical protein AXG93_4620s2090 [Marchantia polymorpha subsp. ruderalis]